MIADATSRIVLCVCEISFNLAMSFRLQRYKFFLHRPVARPTCMSIQSALGRQARRTCQEIENFEILQFGLYIGNDGHFNDNI